jgi:LmbE family N-acetylglucosaminyl deacetylase
MRKVLELSLRRLYARAPRPVRSALRLQFELLARADWPVATEPPTARCALVLAPHMDDEVFGCGGTLARCADAGSRVVVAYLTSGARGHARRGGVGGRELGDRLVATRKQEARRAAAILGLRSLVFFDGEDGDLRVDPAIVRRLAGVAAAVRPDVVFLPFLTDTHRDHWVTNAIWLAAAAEAGLPAEFPCWGYEVWTPLAGNRLVDIKLAVDRKSEAMRQFASQLAEYDYHRAMLSLNAFRSLLVDRGGGHAEAFYVAPLDLYRGLYEAAALYVPRAETAAPGARRAA